MNSGYGACKPVGTGAEELLRIKGLVKYYLQGKEKLVVLNGLDLVITEGEIVSVVGPSGAGKSTLLHLMAGLDSPTSGDIFFKGRNIKSLNELDMAKFRNENIGFVYQFYHLLPEFTALENLCMPGRIYAERNNKNTRTKREEIKKKALNLLERVGLKDKYMHRPGELSGGEQQRVAIARALVNEPDIVLADEPTGNLDRNTARGVEELIFSICEEKGKTIIFATHNEELAKNAKRIIRIVDGKAVV